MKKIIVGGSKLKFIWLTFTINIIVLGILNSLVGPTSSLGIIFVLLHIMIVSIILMSYKSKLKFIFLSGFIARVVLMFWDLFARNIFILPNSGADSEMFYNSALTISNDLSFLGNTRGGIFSDIMGILFKFIGDQRIVGQYINVLFGLSTLILIYKILTLLAINYKTKYFVLMIASFFPNSIIMSAIFLREIIPTFLVTLSLLEFIKWFISGKSSNAALSIFFLGFASMFHSGVIGIIVGYFFGFLFFDRNHNKLRFSVKTVGAFIIMILVIVLSFNYLDDLILRKFRSVEDLTDIYSTANKRLGGSAYLTGLTINNPIQLVVFGPIKSFFFLTAPLPMNWRGFMDVFSFFTDSLLYLIVLTRMILNKPRAYNNTNKILIIIIFIIISSSSLIFGIGVGNAGTAIRHRHKLICLFLVAYAILKEKNIQKE